MKFDLIIIKVNYSKRVKGVKKKAIIMMDIEERENTQWWTSPLLRNLLSNNIIINKRQEQLCLYVQRLLFAVFLRMFTIYLYELGETGHLMDTIITHYFLPVISSKHSLLETLMPFSAMTYTSISPTALHSIGAWVQLSVLLMRQYTDTWNTGTTFTRTFTNWPTLQMVLFNVVVWGWKNKQKNLFK